MEELSGSTTAKGKGKYSLNPVLRQFLIVLAASFAIIPFGMMQSWNNVFSSHIADNNSTIFGREITVVPWQMDLIGSIPEIGGPVGFILAGYFVGLFGRKWSLIVTPIPGILGNAMIAMAVDTYMIIVGRVLDGVTGGMAYVTVSTYVTEISDASVRGTFCMVMLLMLQFGSLLVVSGGTIWTWYYMSIVSGILLLCHSMIALTLHESPSFLVANNCNQRASKFLQKLRASDTDISMEIKYLQDQNLISENSKGYGVLFECQNLLKIGLLGGMFFITNFSGNYILRINAARLLQSMDLAIEEKYTTPLLVMILFLGNVILLLTIDHLGRRRCLIMSLSIIAISCTSLGTFIYFSDASPSLAGEEFMEFSNQLVNTTQAGIENYRSKLISTHDLVSVMLLMGACLGHSLGIGPITWMLPAEMFPTSLRSQATGVCMMMGSVMGFISLQLYTPLLTILTQAGLYWLFASVASGGIFYVYFLVKETSRTKVG